jgi:hypothetical protein
MNEAIALPDLDNTETMTVELLARHGKTPEVRAHARAELATRVIVRPDGLDENAAIYKTGSWGECRDHARKVVGRTVLVRFTDGTFGLADAPARIRGGH